MHEFSFEIQEMMYNACSYTDEDAMKRLMRYRKEEQIQSEEMPRVRAALEKNTNIVVKNRR